MSVQPRADIMANLGKKNGIYLARFCYNGREYQESLKTTDHKAAEAAMHWVESALHRLGMRLSAEKRHDAPKGGAIELQPPLHL